METNAINYWYQKYLAEHKKVQELEKWLESQKWEGDPETHIFVGEVIEKLKSL